MAPEDTTSAAQGSGGDTRLLEPARQPGVGITVGLLAVGDVVTAAPDWTVRRAARTMHQHRVGSVVVVEDDSRLAGILTERDVLRAVATVVDVDAVTVADLMTTDVVTAAPDWQVYEAAATMADRGIRHLVVTEDELVQGVLSIRDLLLAGQRVPLTDGEWVVLRDPLTFTVRERRRLQRALLQLEPGPLEDADLIDVIAVLVASWSFDLPLPPDAEQLAQLSSEDRELLRAAVLDELPYLQAAVHPAPGWRQWG